MSHKCTQCLKKGVLLFPNKNDDDELSWLCTTCMKVKTPHFRFDHRNIDDVIEPYVLKWKLRDENGHERIEEHVDMSKDDFELIYGDNTDEIIWIMFRKKNHALI